MTYCLHMDSGAAWHIAGGVNLGRCPVNGCDLDDADLDRFIEVCVVDGSELLDCWDADENGIRTFYTCRSGEHTYRSRWTGFAWAPVDQGDYEA